MFVSMLQNNLTPQPEQTEFEFKCQKCEKGFETRHLLKNHMATHRHNFVCKVCGTAFGTNQHLKTHLFKHTRVSEFVCEWCGKAFGTNQHLKTHVFKHTRVSDFVCKECGKAFGTKQKLNSHLVRHTGISGFVCSECGKACGSKRQLDSHLVMHTGISDFVCTHCGKAFGTNRQLDIHIVTHTGTSDFVCKHCGKAFGTKRQLRIHSVIHTGVSDHVCTLCGKAFGTKQKLYSHSIMHAGMADGFTADFVCSECGRGFKRKQELKMHSLVHTGLKLFKCDLCQKSFSRKYHLERHQVKHGISGVKSEFDPSTIGYTGMNESNTQTTQFGIPEVVVEETGTSSYRSDNDGNFSGVKSEFDKDMSTIEHIGMNEYNTKSKQLGTPEVVVEGTGTSSYWSDNEKLHLPEIKMKVQDDSFETGEWIHDLSSDNRDSSMRMGQSMQFATGHGRKEESDGWKTVNQPKSGICEVVAADKSGTSCYWSENDEKSQFPSNETEIKVEVLDNSYQTEASFGETSIDDRGSSMLVDSIRHTRRDEFCMKDLPKPRIPVDAAAGENGFPCWPGDDKYCQLPNNEAEGRMEVLDNSFVTESTTKVYFSPGNRTTSMMTGQPMLSAVGYKGMKEFDFMRTKQYLPMTGISQFVAEGKNEPSAGSGDEKFRLPVNEPEIKIEVLDDTYEA